MTVRAFTPLGPRTEQTEMVLDPLDLMHAVVGQIPDAGSTECATTALARTGSGERCSRLPAPLFGSRGDARPRRTAAPRRPPARVTQAREFEAVTSQSQRICRSNFASILRLVTESSRIGFKISTSSPFRSF